MHKLAEEYSDVEYSDILVDNTAMQLIKNPSQFDVIVTENMFGDILSDEASMLTGSIGMMPSASLSSGTLGKNIAYSASKSALMKGMTKSIAMAGAPYNVRCICVSPGPVLTRQAMSHMKTLIGRAAEPQELVDFILFATSDKGAFMTGTDYLIDGGRNVLRNKNADPKPKTPEAAEK